jgi:hypothetical protein
VNVTCKEEDPTGKVVPAGGVYSHVPATLAVAFNCAAPSAVGQGIAAGGAHVITGTAFATLIETVRIAEA